MEIHKYKCDVCGFEMDDSLRYGKDSDSRFRQFYTACVCYEPGMSISFGSCTHVKISKTKLYCEPCAIEHKIISGEKKAIPENTRPTLEEYLSELIANEVQNQIQNQ